MKLLLISDEESPYFWDHYVSGRLDDIDLILSAGDLKPEYLTFLVTLGRARVLYVHGNHDGLYDLRPPEGCECIDDKLVRVAGLRILGLGGCRKYSPGPYQYTDREMHRRILKKTPALWYAKGVDIVLTHAPMRGYGDQEDRAHLGFDCFQPLLDRWQPRYLVHGHVHMSYGHNIPRQQQYGATTIINACGYYILEI